MGRFSVKYIFFGTTHRLVQAPGLSNTNVCRGSARIDTCGTVENARVILEGDDHRRFMAKHRDPV